LSVLRALSILQGTYLNIYPCLLLCMDSTHCFQAINEVKRDSNCLDILFTLFSIQFRFTIPQL